MELFFENVWESGKNMFFEEDPSLFVSEIEINCTQKRFESIRNDIGIGIPSGEEFTFGEENILRKSECESNGGEIFPAYKGTADICKLSFWLLFKFLKKKFCCDELEYGITEEFEAFVTLGDSDDILIEDRSVHEGKTVVCNI